MTISVQGASLLATLFPISMLLLLVEARAAGGVLGPEYERGDGRRAFFAWLTSFRNFFWKTLSALSPIAALAGTVICTVAVCIPARVDAVWAFWVLICGGYQVVATFFVLNRLIRLGVIDNHRASRTSDDYRPLAPLTSLRRRETTEAPRHPRMRRRGTL